MLFEEVEMRGFSVVSYKIELAPFRNTSLERGEKTALED